MSVRKQGGNGRWLMDDRRWLLIHRSTKLCWVAILFVLLLIGVGGFGGFLDNTLSAYAQEAATTPEANQTAMVMVTTTPAPTVSLSLTLSSAIITAPNTPVKRSTPTVSPTTSPAAFASDEAEETSISNAKNGGAKGIVDSAHGFDRVRFYTVKEGDTLWSVALEVGIDLEEVYCAIAPDFSWDQPLVIGDLLEIRPLDFRCHEVVAGETLADIAARYDLLPKQIVEIGWNALDSVDTALVVGQHLRIPVSTLDPAKSGEEISQLLGQPVNTIPFTTLAIGAPTTTERQDSVDVPANWPFGSGNFHWPTYGWLSQGYHAGHRAVDIAAPAGSPVMAADRGVVLRAGWNNQGYGNFIVIDHNIDYVTLYGHLSDVLVSEGQVVGAGDVIGIVGSTGNSTGPHLHFEIRDFGQLTDPLRLLMP